MNQFHHPKLHHIETYLACDNQRLKASSDLFLPFRGFHNDTIHHDIRDASIAYELWMSSVPAGHLVLVICLVTGRPVLHLVSQVPSLVHSRTNFFLARYRDQKQFIELVLQKQG